LNYYAQHQPFNGPSSRTTRVSRYQNSHPLMGDPCGDTCHLIGFIVQGEGNRDRCSDSLVGHHPIRVSWIINFH